MGFFLCKGHVFLVSCLLIAIASLINKNSVLYIRLKPIACAVAGTCAFNVPADAEIKLRISKKMLFAKVNNVSDRGYSTFGILDQ